jgi:quinol monooxygenase YgiN
VYGPIDRFVAHPGRRDELIALMLGEEAIPGCLSFVFAREPGDSDAMWITEVWEPKASWEASTGLPAI